MTETPVNYEGHFPGYLVKVTMNVTPTQSYLLVLMTTSEDTSFENCVGARTVNVAPGDDLKVIIDNTINNFFIDS